MEDGWHQPYQEERLLLSTGAPHLLAHVSSFLGSFLNTLSSETRNLPRLPIHVASHHPSQNP